MKDTLIQIHMMKILQISSEVGLQDDGISVFWLCLFDIYINFLAF